MFVFFILKIINHFFHVVFQALTSIRSHHSKNKLERIRNRKSCEKFLSIHFCFVWFVFWLNSISILYTALISQYSKQTIYNQMYIDVCSFQKLNENNEENEIFRFQFNFPCECSQPVNCVR